MEPFIIEDALLFLFYIVLGGVCFYFFVKRLEEEYMSIQSKPPKAENPMDKVAKAISKCEERRDALNKKIGELQKKHDKFALEVQFARMDLDKWANLEKEKWPDAWHSPDDNQKAHDFRIIVKRRMAAEKRVSVATAAENASEEALEQVCQKCEELTHKIEIARSAQTTLEARMETAKIRQDLADDFGNSPDKAIEELESATIESEAKAEAYEETSRFHNNVIEEKISEDDVSEEIERKRSSKREKNHG